MATYSSKGSKEFEKVSAGTHLAVCTLIADVGLQPGSGQFPDPKVKVFMRWEIPSERLTYEKDGVEKEGPAIIYANYTASMSSKANLRKAIESWRGAKFTDQEAELFDVRKLLGQTCMLQVIHSDDGKYANVGNIMAPPKGTPKIKPEGTAIYYGPDDDAKYADLPKFLQNKVDMQLGPDALKKDAPPLNKESPQSYNKRAEAASKAAAFERRPDDFEDFPNEELPPF